LETGAEIGVQDQVVFSGASVIKIAIMLQVYRVMDDPPAGIVAQDLWGMMVHSDNDAANRLMAFGGDGNASAGAQAMSDMLAQLGLVHSYMRGPYGSSRPRDQQSPEEGQEAPGEGQQTPEEGQEAPGEGQESPQGNNGRPAGRAFPRMQEPVTNPDPWLQTTPRDMALLLHYLYDCGQGESSLLELFPGEITQEECRDMLNLMAQNADDNRMVAGLPEGVPCAHKSGWISDMKADAGIVYSSGGTYIFSAFAWEEGSLSDAQGNPRIAALSWISYSFFNPFAVPLDEP
jgi:beta-lactamase class A